MKITEDIKYIGVNDFDIDLFEGQYPVPDGISYNSYVILDEKIAVTDTVDSPFTAEWLENLARELGGKEPDYLIIHHMEPDHSASVAAFAEKYPSAVLVASAKAFAMAEAFFPGNGFENRLVVAGGSTLALGRHTLTFVAAPMVHWPEVLVSFDSLSGTLFSADAFGKFGVPGTGDDWACEARRYYFGIVGKFGAPVQQLLKAAKALDIRIICPLHGPVLHGDLHRYFELYDIWSSYEPEAPHGVTVAYATFHGNTRKAALAAAEALRSRGEKDVTVYDLARDDLSEAIENAFRCGRLIIAAPSYNGDVAPSVRDFISRLAARSFRKRTVGIIENGSWAPSAAKAIRSLLEPCADITFAEPVATVRSALNEKSLSEIEALAEAILK